MKKKIILFEKIKCKCKLNRDNFNLLIMFK